MNKYQKMCNDIIKNIGGSSNISYATHCMTRLRIDLKDQSKVNVENTKNIEGVLGCQFSAGQFQIIIGQHVDAVYDEFSVLANISNSNKTNNNEISEKNKLKISDIPKKIMDAISGCVTPILPIITATGIIKLIYSLLAPGMLNILPETSDFMVLLNLVGNAGFYFFPIFVAWAASKKFNTSTPLALFISAILIHPTLIGIVEAGDPFSVYGLPMSLVNYTSQFLPSILIVWILSYVYKFFNKYSPSSLKIILVPTLTMLVMLPVSLSIVGPVGNVLGTGLSSLFTILFDLVGPFAVALIGALWYFLVATGMHQALIALTVTTISMNGSDNLISVGAMAATYALMGLSVAYLIRSSKKDKALASSNTITLLVGGISEPTIFSLLLQNKKAMIIQLSAGALGGLIASLLNVKIYFFGATNILGLLAYGEDIVLGIVVSIATFLIALVMGILIGFDDNKSNKNRENKSISEKKEENKSTLDESFNSPLAGKLVSLEEVSDPTFSNHLMGDGCAIIPNNGEVYSPFDGEVVALFPTGHAIGLKNEDGIELLIHIGIDTVNNGGESFNPLVSIGDKVKVGQPIIDFDFEQLSTEGYDLITAIVITNEPLSIVVEKNKQIAVGDKLVLAKNIE